MVLTNLLRKSLKMGLLQVIMITMIDTSTWMDFLQRFASYGPFAGIFLIMLEAFIPILPLSVFVTVNIMAYGFWQGYLYSWIGNTGGSMLVFYLIRRYSSESFKEKIQNNRKIKNTFLWIKKYGFFPIFILLTFPFTPSFLICGLSALAGISYKTFAYAIIIGKLIMILSLSFIGYNLSEFVQHPIKSMIFISITLLLSLIAKRVMRLNDKHLEEINGKEQAKPDNEIQ